MNSLKKVFDADQDHDELNEIVVDLKSKKATDSDLALFSMLGDAIKEKTDVFRLDKSIRSRKSIPELRFL